MHPQRTLIEAAMLVQEVAIDDTPQEYDRRYHADAAGGEMRKIKRPPGPSTMESVQERIAQKKSIIKQYNPMVFHAERAADHLAKQYLNSSSVPHDAVETIMGHHHDGYMGDLLKHHSDKYPKLLSGHGPTLERHKEQFRTSVTKILNALHGLNLTDNGIEGGDAEHPFLF